MTDEHAVPLCKNCRHSFIPVSQTIFLPFIWLSKIISKDDNDQYLYRCRKLIKGDETLFNPVTGMKLKSKEYKLCASARDTYNEQCGPDGKLWTPKDTKDFFVWLKRL